MALATDKLGSTYGGHLEPVDGHRALAYAAATNDDNPAYGTGTVAPLVFGVVPAWQAMSEALSAVVPAEDYRMLVHGEQDMHLHRPLVPGTTLDTTSEAFSLRVGRSGSRYTIRVRSVDAGAGDLVLEQFVTMFIRGASEGESAGPDKPSHTFPHEARTRPVGSFTTHVDLDQTQRYAEASGDHNAIHLDDEVARAVGLQGRILHGLCTMAMTGAAVVQAGAAGDPARLRRLAVRFSRPVYPGTDVVTTVYDAGPNEGRRVFAFEAHSNGELVISNGRAEVAEPGD